MTMIQRAGTAQKGFGWGGGGGLIKNDKNVTFFFFCKKGKGPKDPQPSLCVVSGEAVNIEFFYFRNNAESDKNRTFFDMVTGTSSSFKVINQSLTTSYEYFFPGIPGEQLVRGKLTVKVVVRTQEDAYIGETKYTYNSNLLRQFEQCVKALDDEDMELDCTGSPVEHHVTMSLRGTFTELTL